MIKNQKQAGITKIRLAELRKTHETLITKKENYSDLEYELSENALLGMIEDLEKQLKIYEGLVNNNFHIWKPKNLEDLSNALIAARLAQNLSQQDLALKLGIKEQQVQRYEATDFESASWTKICEFSNALNIEFTFESVLIVNPEISHDNFEIPKSYSQEKVQQVEEIIRKSHSILINQT
jgi:transcriptional regulator with XRE-family HTH domain